MVYKSTHCHLEDIAHLRNGAGIKQNSFGENGIPIVRVSDFTENSVDISHSIFLREEELDKWKSFLLEIDEILVATVGSWGTSATSAVGKVVRIPESAINCIQNQNTCSIKAIEGIASQRWVYYALKHPDFRHFVDSAAAGSANQARLAVKNLRKYPLSVPCLSDQKAIAHILGTLDDKIELHQKMNLTLEETAKSIFKSWFVDFDPVRAKAEGRPTGLPPEVNDLFPNELVDSEIGEIPKGWEIGALGDLFDIQYGKNLPKKNLTGEGYPVFGANGVIGFHSTYLYEEPMTLIGCRGVAGNVGRSLPRSFVTNNSLVINHEGAKLTSQRFIEFVLASGETESYVTGSAQPQLTIEKIKDFPFMIPTLEIVGNFQSIIDPISSQQLTSSRENKTLAELRDTLLPKLISGELRIPDAEKFLEQAGI